MRKSLKLLPESRVFCIFPYEIFLTFAGREQNIGMFSLHSHIEEGSVLYRSTVRSVLAVFLAGHLMLMMAASPAIGVAVTRGSFSVDSSLVSGNATIFEGNTIETSKIASELRLNSGARMQLGSESKAKVYRDRLVLERGLGEIEKLDLEALSLRVAPSAGARVSIRNSGVLQVAALNGPVRVTRNGVLVANVLAGSALDFEPQAAGAAAASTMTGCLQRAGGKYLLKDETANVTVELQGDGLSAQAGNRVEVSGAMVPGATPASGATQVVKITSIKMISKGCGSKAGAGAAAAGTGAAVGMAVGTKVIIAAVVIGGVATGAAVAATRGGENNPVSPSSR
jgi:hypothetical protein